MQLHFGTRISLESTSRELYFFYESVYRHVFRVVVAHLKKAFGSRTRMFRTLIVLENSWFIIIFLILTIPSYPCGKSSVRPLCRTHLSCPLLKNWSMIHCRRKKLHDLFWKNTSSYLSRVIKIAKLRLPTDERLRTSQTKTEFKA